MWQIDQTTLRLFIAVCEEGTIARAAEREFIAPSAVSKRLADLEALVDVALLSRGQRGVRATAAGIAFLKHARIVLRSYERLQAELGEYAAGASGHVRVLANVSSMVEFLPEALSVFLNANPQIRVDVEERVSVDIVRGLEEGVADIGICRDVVPTGELDVLPYRSDHLALVVPNDHPFAAEAEISFEQTLAFDHLGLASNASVNALMQRIAAEKGRELQYRSYVSTFDAACRFVQAGLAVSILPGEAVAPHIRQQYGLAVIPLRETWAERRFVICVRDRAALTVPAARLLDHLLKTAQTPAGAPATAPTQ
ncbi:LysR family transcriptional regulator [Paraburkholderia sp. BL10I2N1]|uniref:LysR family transcriptional regulator n=1 Tax=Paraburkholderia sp. BL10I2N1 TaxID=1938796 RepID=UPI00105C3A8A|nr:LysR family transcriptional regulator [Paraburkholderia sp. BL10I2N1]TDN61100.1 LysR family transcriptional regulator [Paraburkholderia sp. BL10I2N1]